MVDVEADPRHDHPCGRCERGDQVEQEHHEENDRQRGQDPPPSRFEHLVASVVDRGQTALTQVKRGGVRRPGRVRPDGHGWMACGVVVGC